MKNKVIHRSTGAFGGSVFKAVDRGTVITIEESVSGLAWRVLATTTPQRFYDLADKFDLFDPYRQNSAALWKIAGEIVR